MDITNNIITILSLVILFLFAIQKFSRHVEEMAGDRLKTILNNWTKTPLRGVIAGTILTAILESSTAATIILVGLVNSEIMPFISALGVVIGMNIGTTITAELIALNMTYLAPIVVIVGFVISHTHSRFRKYGKTVFYFGVMFLCLLMISFIIAPLKDDPSVISIIKIQEAFTEQCSLELSPQQYSNQAQCLWD